MAISYGGISAVSTSQTPTSVAVSGSNTLGIIFVVGDSAADNISAVTWGGSSMTKIGAVQNPGDRWMSAWYIANPSSGAAIAFTGGSFWRSFSFYYTGVKQTGQPDSFNTGSGSSIDHLTIASTVVAANSWFVMCTKDGSGAKTYTASGVLGSVRANTDAGGICIADSNAIVSTGSQSGTLTDGAGLSMGGIAFSIVPAATVNTLVVGGGGGGGGSSVAGAGGGGAGGYQANTALSVTPQAYTITVGTGGGGGASSNAPGSVGNASSFSTITADGGGGGGWLSVGGNGGSGGGGSASSGTNAGGTATQGSNGGIGQGSAEPGGGVNGGGGGGATSVGAGADNGHTGGAGGAGTANSISGASVTYAGGGGGASDSRETSHVDGAGGAGGGGGASHTGVGTAGTANTGGGGGGGIGGGTGGSGIVIISYPTDGSTGVSTSSTGGTITTSGANTIHTFTASGTWTMVAASAATTYRRLGLLGVGN